MAKLTKKQAGSLGGRKTVEKYGSDYMKELARRGAIAMHKKYKLVPTGQNDFALVHRDTDKPTGKTINGKYIPMEQTVTEF